MRRFFLDRGNLSSLVGKVKGILGLGIESSSVPSGRAARAGVISSVIFLSVVAAWMAWASNSLGVLPISLASLGVLILFFSLEKKLTLSRANLLALLGHMCALFSFYIFYTRLVNVTYATDSIVGTYMGVVKVLQLQNPYTYSIRSLLEQFGFPPSFYTPRVDGSFEFHLNYPAMNFLSLIPMYAAGLHDLRDGVFIFHVVSILTIFSLVPPRLKALSLAPFVLGFPLAIGYSWTDSIWAFFILLTTILWYRSRGLSLLSFGLAAATKQIAFVAAPFLLIRLWNDSGDSKLGSFLKGSALVIAGFLTPNIPFILTSPSSWWAGTIGPYLPSNAPLVPGGIGLSEILPDVGLALSPDFFTILTGIVSILCLTAFAVRYRKLNRFLWAMPVLILFFYPRSLPNYIVYWAFPYLFEWFRRGNPSLSLAQLRAVGSAFLKPTGAELLGALRGKVGPSILVILALTTALFGASGAYAAQASRTKVDVTVDRMTDPDSLGVVTNLSVTITNSGSEYVLPRFFVKWFFLWDLWTANNTAGVPPDRAASYGLKATDALAGVPRGSSFRVAVYDSISGQLLGQSQPYVSNVDRPPVANPRFTWWTLDIGTGRQVPFPWKLSFVNVGRTEGGISIADINSSSGVEMRFNSTMDKQPAGELVLSQRLLFNETNLNILIYQPSSANPLESAVLGAEATDGTHTLYFVFSTKATGRTVTSFPENTTVTLPLVYSSWENAFLNIQSTWLSQGWNPSTSLDVSFFLRLNQIGLLLAKIQQVTPAGSGSQ